MSPVTKTTKVVTLTDDTQYTAIPGTGTTILVGPGKLSVTRRSDGKVNGRILEGKPMPAALAGIQNLKRIAWGI